MNTKEMNRRELLKKSVAGSAALSSAYMLAACTKSEKPSAPVLEAAKPAPEAKPALEYVSPTDATASALNYTEDASTVSEDIRVEKMGKTGAEQFCTNCQFYTAEESTNGEGGKCSLFPNKLVKGKGWCKSWALKA